MAINIQYISTAGLDSNDGLNSSSDDGSCSGYYGCTNGYACNYDSGASCDDGSCYWGCTDVNARDYHSGCDNCWYIDCNDSAAINYDENSFGTSECAYLDCIGNIYYSNSNFFTDSNGQNCTYLAITRDTLTCCGQGTYACGWDINGALFFDDCWNCGYGNTYDNLGTYNGCCHNKIDDCHDCDGNCICYDACGCGTETDACGNCVALGTGCYRSCVHGICNCTDDYGCGCNSDGSSIGGGCYDCYGNCICNTDDCGSCGGSCFTNGYCNKGICGCTDDYGCGCNSDGSSIGPQDDCSNCGGSCFTNGYCYNGICGCSDDYGCGCNSDGSSIGLDALGYCGGTCQDALACSEDQYGCMFIDPNTGLCTSRNNQYFSKIISTSGSGVIKLTSGSGKISSNGSLPLINSGFIGWINRLSNYKYMIRFDWDNCAMGENALLTSDSIIADGIRYSSDPNFTNIDGLSVWQVNGNGTATCVYASGNYVNIENNTLQAYIGAVMNVSDLQNSQNGIHILNDSVMLGCLTGEESFCCTDLTLNRPLQTAVLCNSWFVAKY